MKKLKEFNVPPSPAEVERYQYPGVGAEQRAAAKAMDITKKLKDDQARDKARRDRQEAIGKAEAENVELLSRIQNMQMGQSAAQAKKAREEQEKAMAKLQDRSSRQTGTGRGSQRGTGELSPLAIRQAGATPITQAEVDFTGAFDRRTKSAAARGKGAVSGLDFSTAVRPGSKDGSEGAASTPTVVTGGQPSLSDPNRPGRLQRTQDYFKNIAANVPVAVGQLATAAQQKAQQTVSDIKRDFENPDLERSQQQTRNVVDFLLDPLPDRFSKKNLVRYAVDQATDKIEPVLNRITTALQPVDDTATSVSRATAQSAARTGRLEPFVTGTKAADTPDDFMKLRDPGSDTTIKSPTEPTVSQPGSNVTGLDDLIQAARRGQIEPTIGPRDPIPTAEIPTGTSAVPEVNPYSVSFTRSRQRRTDTAAETKKPAASTTQKAINNLKAKPAEFKEPKNFTQLQKLYNQGLVTAKQYEKYKDKFLTAESRLDTIRKIIRG